MSRLNALSFALLTVSSVPLVLGVGLGCQPATYDDLGDGETGDGNGDGDGDGDSGGGSGDGDPDTGGDPTFNCDPNVAMPCEPGQKCTILISGGSPPIYECVPDDAEKLPYESCTPAPSTGQDGCPGNHACIAPSGSSTGQCLRLCSDDSACDSGVCVTPTGQQVPVCGTICDPLAPSCPAGHACQRVGHSNFVCQYPAEGDVGITAEPCSASQDSGCAQGFVCEAGVIVPGCTEMSCCTALCDLSEANLCTPPMVCGELPLDPHPVLENVGACYVPQ